MSLSDLEAEARKIIEEAEKKAKEIIEEAIREAKEWKEKKIDSPLSEDEINKVINEFREKIQKAIKVHQRKKKIIEENYSKKKDEIIKEVIKAVTGV
ncbi:MAG: hypothetical protein DRO14_03475 [Thermoprotei archaeon]|nr:MAG: hypothetical protein DRO14_03475 [Thermoprotei archaeon]